MNRRERKWLKYLTQVTMNNGLFTSIFSGLI